MSKLNPEPNLIHIMGCYVLGSANGEKVWISSFPVLGKMLVTFSKICHVGFPEIPVVKLLDFLLLPFLIPGIFQTGSLQKNAFF